MLALCLLLFFLLSVSFFTGSSAYLSIYGSFRQLAQLYIALMPTPDATRQMPAFTGASAPKAAQAKLATVTAPPADSTLAVSQPARVVEFGIECRRTLEWQPGWEPGGKYTRKIVLKNMLSHTLRISYTLPTSKIFLVPYPDMITLSPGIVMGTLSV